MAEKTNPIISFLVDSLRLGSPTYYRIILSNWLRWTCTSTWYIIRFIIYLTNIYNINILRILNPREILPYVIIAIQLITHTHEFSYEIGKFSLSLCLRLSIRPNAIDMSILLFFFYFFILIPLFWCFVLCVAPFAVSFNCLVLGARCSVVMQPDSYIYEIVINRERTDLLFYHYLYFILRN